MLTQSGRLAGDLTVMRLDSDRFWLMGSYYLQSWHMRWFKDHLPKSGVKVENLCGQWSGISICGPNSRSLLGELTGTDVSNSTIPFMSVQKVSLGHCEAILGRLSVTGELGYEINVPNSSQPALLKALVDLGRSYDARLFGFRAMNALRMEKGFGVWSSEFTSEYTPEMNDLERFIDFEKKDFMGKQHALARRQQPASRTLVLLQIDSPDADVSGFEPVSLDNEVVGFVTSGGYGHWVRLSLAFAYVDRRRISESASYTVDVVGRGCSAKLLSEVPYDPHGHRMRS